jgi:hypothetical protein
MHYPQHRAIKKGRKLNYKGIFTLHSLPVCAERYSCTRKYVVNMGEVASVNQGLTDFLGETL